MDSSKKDFLARVLLFPLTLGVVLCAHDGGPGLAWTHTSQQVLKRGEIQYCGSRLFEAIRTLCQGNYAALTRRSDPSLTSNGGYLDESVDFQEKNILDKLFPALTNERLANEIETEYRESIDDSSVEDLDVIWARNTKTRPMKLVIDDSNHRRVRRNVIDECCKRPCGVRTMLKYCGSVRQ